MLKTLMLAISSVVIASSSHAATISETTDFTPNLAIPFNIGTLDIGTNTISGSLAATCVDFDVNPFVGDSCSFAAFDAADAFEFVIPTGSELTSATLTITNLVDVMVFGTSFTSLRDLGAVGEGVVDILDGSNLTGTQDYRINLVGFASLGASGSASWQVDLAVAPISAVPLPAGLPLLLAGVGAFGLVRRKRSKSV